MAPVLSMQCSQPVIPPTLLKASPNPAMLPVPRVQPPRVTHAARATDAILGKRCGLEADKQHEDGGRKESGRIRISKKFLKRVRAKGEA